jgi:hypothetical protein
MGGLRLVDGREAKLVTGLDDHSRFCVAAGVVAHATARAVCQVFAAALARHGVPQELLTDNGKVFTGRFAPHPGEVLFDRSCRENGSTHRLTAPGSPTTTGKVERFHKTLRTELLDGLRFDSLVQAQQVIDAWVSDDNTRRPHQALAMATPAQRFQVSAGPAIPPEPPLVVAQELTRHAGRLRPDGAGEIARLVHSNGVIVVTRQVCSVGRRYAGKQLTVQVEPTTCTSPATASQDDPSHHQRGGDPGQRPPTQEPSSSSLAGVTHHPTPPRQPSGETRQPTSDTDM